MVHIVDQDINKGYIRFGWEKLRLYIRFKVDYLDQTVKNLEEAVTNEESKNRHWSYYAQGADLLLSVNEKPETALKWAKASTELREHGWNYYILARAEAANGNFKNAVDHVAKCKELDDASEKDNYYTDMKGEIEAKLAEWSSKS